MTKAKPNPVLTESVELLDSLDAQGNDNNDGVVATDVLDELLAVAGIATEPTTAVIIFAQDYRGVLTNEAYFLKGTAAEFPLSQAASLVEAGRATYKD